MTMLDASLNNLLSPMVLFFVLGFLAAIVRSDLTMPEAAAKLLALYLLLSIGFRGGAEVSHHGLDVTLILSLLAGVALSFGIPILAFALLKTVTRLGTVDAAAIAAHYGSISAVTLVAVTGALNQRNIPFEGYLIAVAAAMETPAILTALLIARSEKNGQPSQMTEGSGHLLREVAFNGSVVMLLGAFAIGAITGQRGLIMLKPFILDPFLGILCLFLLDMGLIAGRGLNQARHQLKPALIGFAILMPLINAAVAAPIALGIGLSEGGAAVLITLAASASYIAVPAAMRLALPQANPALSLTLSLAVTFPFNLLIGIPLYIAIATKLMAP